jgi:hypothetical protein
MIAPQPSPATKPRNFKMMLTTYRCRVNIYTIGEAYHTQARPPLVYDHTVGTETSGRLQGCIQG